MRPVSKFLKYAVTASAIALLCAGGARAQDADLPTLLEQLADPGNRNWQLVERQIRTEWSRSGSPSMDLLLQRGEKALEEKAYAAALEHFTALTDHAPDFAEGWNARATALFHLDLYGPAVEDLSRALTLNPQHFEAMIGLAVISQRVGREQQALELWRMIAKIHPHRPEVGQAIEQLQGLLAGEAL